MFTNTVAPDNFLTPSEVVFLNGELFAKKATLGNVQLLHSDEKVSLNQLVQAILTAVILAGEQAGAFRLEVQERKAMLGLRKVQKLFAVPANASQVLPENSLEAAFSDLAARLKPDDKNDISTIIYTWLRKDSFSPWGTALDFVKAGMERRGLLEAEGVKRLKIFTETVYTLPDRTAVLIKGQSVESVKAMLENCARTRPEVWKLLDSSIKKAISDRTESSDTDVD